MSKELGKQAEDRAVKYLKKQKLGILERNFYSRFGEIDIVAEEQDTIVFVEVRYRRDNAFGSALESVSYGKQQKLIKTAQCFIAAHPWAGDRPCRFDIIAIGSTGIQWLPSAFSL